VERGEEIPRGLIVARSDATDLFEFAEEILDQVACLVERLIKRAGRCSVLPRRDDGGFSGLRQRLEDALVGIVGFVGDQHLGGHLRQQRIGADEIMGLSRGQQEAQRIAERVDQSMDFGAQSAFAAADRLIIVFFWAPALCWWARTMVLSIIAYSLSGSAAKSSKRRCHTPFLAQRLNRLCVFFQSPNRSGRSRQGIPVR
jgi:hypothetical protein